MNAIGIDLGGTFIKAGIVDEAGKILVKGRGPPAPASAGTRPPSGHGGPSLELVEQCGQQPLSDIGASARHPGSSQTTAWCRCSPTFLHDVPWSGSCALTR